MTRIDLDLAASHDDHATTPKPPTLRELVRDWEEAIQEDRRRPSCASEQAVVAAKLAVERPCRRWNQGSTVRAHHVADVLRALDAEGDK